MIGKIFSVCTLIVPVLIVSNFSLRRCKVKLYATRWNVTFCPKGSEIQASILPSHCMIDRLYTEFTGHDASIYALEWDGDDIIYSGGADRVVASWSIEHMAPENFSVRTDSGIYSLLLTESFLWIGLVNGDMHVIDMEGKKEIKHFQLHKKGTFHLERHGNTLISCGGDGTIGIWDIDQLDLVRHIPLSNQKIRQARFSEDGRHLAICCSDGTLRILETNLFNEIANVSHKEGGVNTCLWVDDGLISGGWDGHLYSYSLDESFSQVSAIPAHKFAIYDIRSMGDLIITASRDKRIKIWKLDNTESKGLKCIQRLEYPQSPGHTHSVNRLEIIDNHRFISGGDDKVIKVWA